MGNLSNRRVEAAVTLSRSVQSTARAKPARSLTLTLECRERGAVIIVLLVLTAVSSSIAIAESGEVMASDIEILEAILHDTIRPKAEKITLGEATAESPPVVLVSGTIDIGSS